MSTLALPLRIAPDGTLAAIDPQGPLAIGQSVAVIAATPLGDRRAVPLFGSIDQLFVSVGAVTVDRAAVNRWEDRATDDVLRQSVRASAGTHA